jgi:hypothetical protein
MILNKDNNLAGSIKLIRAVQKINNGRSGTRMRKSNLVEVFLERSSRQVAILAPSRKRGGNINSVNGLLTIKFQFY